MRFSCLKHIIDLQGFTICHGANHFSLQQAKNFILKQQNIENIVWAFIEPVQGSFLLPKTEPSTIARNPINAENKGFSAENNAESSDALRPKRERKVTERVVGEGCRQEL